MDQLAGRRLVARAVAVGKCAGDCDPSGRSVHSAVSNGCLGVFLE